MIKCTMDGAIDENSECAKCCIYCSKENCEYRCVLSKTCKKEEDVFKKDCVHAYDV